MSQEIVLNKYQLICSLKNCHNLKNSGIVLATSNTGKGKSVMLSWCLQRMKVKNAIMICTSTLIPMWESYKQKYDLPFLGIISYETLRGVASPEDTVLKHGLLIRKSNGTFQVTDTFKELVEEGLVICADESQKFKNTCDIQKAMQAMCTYIFDRRNMLPLPSELIGVYFNSTTPFDMDHHLVNFCYTVGIIKSNCLIEKETEKRLGLEELYNFCLTLDREKTDDIMGTMSMRYKNAENVAYRLCIDVFLPKIASFVNGKKLPNSEIDSIIDSLVATSSFDPTNLTVTEYCDDEPINKQTIYNIHCPLNGTEKQIVRLGYSLIHPSATAKVKITDEMENIYSDIIDAPSPLRSRSGITHGQMIVHTMKTFSCICPMVKHFLDTVKSSKAIVFLDYKECIAVAVNELQDYGIIVITGDNTTAEREELRLMFQEPNLNYRVLVTMNQISSIGTEYDDKHGGFPRAGFGIQNYIVSNSVQCPGRIGRENTQTNSLFFYVKYENEDDENLEESVDRNIKEKSRVLREALKNNGIIPPDSFIDIKYSPEMDFNDLLQNAGKDKYVTVTKKPVKVAAPIIKRTSMVKEFI